MVEGISSQSSAPLDSSTTVSRAQQGPQVPSLLGTNKVIQVDPLLSLEWCPSGPAGG